MQKKKKKKISSKNFFGKENEQKLISSPVFPEVSVAVQDTVVSPSANVVLVVALQLIEASQLSLVDVPSVATVEEQSPGCVLVTMLVGHDATGSSLSVTVTVNVHEPTNNF